MKTKFFLIALLISFVSFSAFTPSSKMLSGKSNTTFGKYTIKLSDELMKFKGQEVETWVLNYEKGEQPVYIGVLEKKNCRDFVVRSAKFEVQYVCRKNGFGVKRISPKYSSLDMERNNARIDDLEFSRQQVITKMDKSNEELLGLIACYFPSLLKDEYKNVLL